MRLNAPARGHRRLRNLLVRTRSRRQLPDRRLLAFGYRFPSDFHIAEQRHYRLPLAMADLRTSFVLVDAAEPNTTFLRYEAFHSGRLIVVRRHAGRQFRRLFRRVPRLAERLDWLLMRRALERLSVSECSLLVAGPDPDFSPPPWLNALHLDLQDPPFSSAADRWERIAALAKRCHLITATSSALVDSLGSLGFKAHLLPNAGPGAVSTPCRENSGQVALYVGTIDDRFDVPTCSEVAALLPNITFVLAGRVNQSVADRVAPLAAQDNVQVLSTITEDHKLSLLLEADVAFIPFRVDEIGDAINPTKVYEFAAYGLPIVATATRACRELSPFVQVGTNAHELAQLIERAARCSLPVRSQTEFASANTWVDRARRLDQLLRDQCDG